MKTKKIALMLVLFSAVSLWLIAAGNYIQAKEISSPLKYIPQDFDVLNYSAVLDFRSAVGKNMQGISKIKIFWQNVSDSSLFYFHLRDLTVDSVKYNDIDAEFDIQNDPSSSVYHYRVVPPVAVARDTAIITIWYHGEMTNADNFGGVFSGDEVLFSVGVGFRNNYVGTTQHWLACYDHPSDKATYDFTFITPRNLNVASNGIFQWAKDTIIDKETYKLTRWASEKPIATYLMTFACGEYVKLDFEGSDYPTAVYCKADDSVACRFVFKKVPDMVKCYEKYYGEYPFDKVGYVVTPLESGAMEHQTMITMSGSLVRKLYSRLDSMNSTAAHELSHQWFGDALTPFDYRDAWFNEGFATFSEAIWREYNSGFKDNLNLLSTYINQYINNFSQFEGVFPLYDFPREAPSSNYPVTIYYKGAAVVGMLRYYLGDEVFFGALRELISQSNYGNINVKSLQEFFENYSGSDLDWFFNQWIYGKGYPVLDVTTYKSKSDAEGFYKAEIRLNQVQDEEWGTYINLPVNFVFADINGNKVSKTFIMNSREAVFYLDSLPDFYAPLINKGDSVRALLKIQKTVTSADKNVSDLDVKIYPNPAYNSIYVDFNDISSIKSVKVLDLNSRLVADYTIEELPQSGLLKIDLKGFAGGLYFVQIETNNLVKTLTFIRQ